MTVRPHAPNLLPQPPRPRNNVLRIYLFGHFQMLIHQVRVLEQTDDLAPVRDGHLVQPLLLRVANVGSDDFIEWQIGRVPRSKPLRVLVRFQCQLAPDGVLDVPDSRVDIIDRQCRLPLPLAVPVGGGHGEVSRMNTDCRCRVCTADPAFTFQQATAQWHRVVKISKQSRRTGRNSDSIHCCVCPAP